MRSYPELPQTSDAVFDLRVNGYRRHGAHDSSVTKVSKTGRTVREQPHDPVKDKVLPNPLSISKILYRDEYVKVRHPRTSMPMNIVVHADHTDRAYAPWLTAAKDRTMETVAGALASMNVGRGDRKNIYVTGDTQRLNKELIRDAYGVIESDDPIKISKEIEDICFGGLTFIISTFKSLDIGAEKQRTIGTQPPVGIKVNHLFELALQPDTGKFATGELENPYIDTSDELQLSEWNKILATRNAAVDSYLGSRGLALARVTFMGRQVDQNYGFNVQDVDMSIACALMAE